MIGERLDPRVAAREALRVIVQEPGGWPSDAPVVMRNLLMDACGGDIKPLANLLLAAAAHDYVTQIVEVRDRGRDAWDRLRTQLVIGWVAEGFLQRDAALWAIESWAYALGVIDTAQLTVPAPSSPTRGAAIVPPAPVARAGATTRARTPPSMTAPARRGPGRPVPLPAPALRPAFSTTGVARSRNTLRLSLGVAVAIPVLAAMVVATGPVGRARQSADALPATTVAREAIAGTARDSTQAIDDRLDGVPPTAPSLAPSIARRDTTASITAPRGTTGAATSPSAPFVPTPGPLAFEPEGGGTAGASGSARSAGAWSEASGERAVRSGPGVTSITANALPSSQRDSLRTLYVRPPTRAAGLPNGLPRGAVPMTGLIAAVPTLDELYLRSGRVLRGRVEIIRASMVLFRDADDGLRYEFPKSDVESIHTEIGTVVRFDASGAPLSAKRGSLVQRGVGGRYTVSYRVRSVRGSANCTGLWQRPLRQDRVTVQHEPSADTLVVAFEGGDQFPSVMDRDANFASTFRIVPDQAQRSTAVTTRLNGRFTTSGFDGEINVIAYQRARVGDDSACHSIIDMRAVRAPETPTGTRPVTGARK